MNDMTANQPYLLRAFFDWIVDNGLTPYIVVDATKEGVDVPSEFVQDGQIVLNVSPSACVNMHMDLEIVSFQARFGGTPRYLSMPCESVMAIYARENGAGTVFVNDKASAQSEQKSASEITTAESDNANVGKNSKTPPSGKPTLTVVK